MRAPISRELFGIIGASIVVVCTASALSAWTGPTATPPDGNVSAPVNVGTSDQVKDGGLSVDAFAAFGNAYFAGNVGIGEPSPAQKLVVDGNSWISGNLVVQDGTVGIGTSNPAATADLHINSAYAPIARFSSDSTSMYFTMYQRTPNQGADAGCGNGSFTITRYDYDDWCIFSNGTIAVGANLVHSSDARLKTDIRALDASEGLAALDLLRPVTFHWLDTGKPTGAQFGFIAQDVAQVFPQLVIGAGTNVVRLADGSTKEVPDALSLNYEGLIAPLVKSVQELHAQVAAQQEEIDALRSRIEALE
jgi:hypothetical protein